MIGNNGPIDPQGAAKATQFFRALRPGRTSDRVSEQHDRLHGRHRIRTGRHDQARL